MFSNPPSEALALILASLKQTADFSVPDSTFFKPNVAIYQAPRPISACGRPKRFDVPAHPECSGRIFTASELSTTRLAATPQPFPAGLGQSKTDD